MDHAIEQAIEGSSAHPERTAFVEADSPHGGREIVRALDDGYAVALVCADGDERIIVAKALSDIDFTSGQMIAGALRFTMAEWSLPHPHARGMQVLPPREHRPHRPPAPTS